jgi:hypothetical protein
LSQNINVAQAKLKAEKMCKWSDFGGFWIIRFFWILSSSKVANTLEGCLNVLTFIYYFSQIWLNLLMDDHEQCLFFFPW